MASSRPPVSGTTPSSFNSPPLGFTQLFSEPSVFFKGAGNDFIVISVHVDDQTIISRYLPAIVSLKHALANGFGIDDLGETTYTLGLEVQRNFASGTLLLSQRKFVATILERLSPRERALGGSMQSPQLPTTNN